MIQMTKTHSLVKNPHVMGKIPRLLIPTATKNSFPTSGAGVSTAVDAMNLQNLSKRVVER